MFYVLDLSKVCIFSKSRNTPVQMCSSLPLLVRSGYCLSVLCWADRPDFYYSSPLCSVFTSDWSSSLPPSSSFLRFRCDVTVCPNVDSENLQKAAFCLFFFLFWSDSVFVPSLHLLSLLSSLSRLPQSACLSCPQCGEHRAELGWNGKSHDPLIHSNSVFL